MPETGVQVDVQKRYGQRNQSLLQELDSGLHELSQPITVLLCTLEYGAGLESADEIKPLLFAAREASERLRETALAMRTLLQKAFREAGSA